MIIIDVRTKEEFDAGHIDDALLCDIRDMMRGNFPNVAKDAEIVLYCESGNRAMMAVTLMNNAGFVNVTNGGSMDACRECMKS